MRRSCPFIFLLVPFLFRLIFFVDVLAQSEEASIINDTCEKSLTIAPGSFMTGSTVGISSNQPSNEVGLLQCSDDIFEIENPGLWFVYKADTSRVLKLSTCAEETNFPTRITAFAVEEGDCSSRSCFDTSVANDPNCPYENSTILELSSTGGTIYSIFVHNQLSDSSGDFALSVRDISPSPNGTSCDTAIELPQNQTLQGTTVGASLGQGAEADQCIDVLPQNPGVFYYIPPVTVPSIVSISIAGALVPFNISVYQGSSCDELECQDVTGKSEGVTTHTSWLAKANEGSYFVYVSAAENGEANVTDRFGIVMIQQAADEPVNSSTATRQWSIAKTFLLFCSIFLVL